MQIRTHVGISLDGFLATPDGMPTWDSLPAFDPGTHGYDTFMERCDAVVMGRTSFDQGFEDWSKAWPWPDMQVLVLTSRPLAANVPEGVHASPGGPGGAVQQLRDAGVTRDVQVLGGARAIQSFLDAGLLDGLGIVVLPLVLGSGIPLFPIEPTAFSREAWDARQAATTETPKPPLLRLEEHDAYADGSMHLVYAPA